MIKVFTLNKNNKIELTKEELESLLNESYWEGHNKKDYWTYVSPYYCTNTTANSITLTNIKNGEGLEKI